MRGAAVEWQLEADVAEIVIVVEVVIHGPIHLGEILPDLVHGDAGSPLASDLGIQRACKPCTTSKNPALSYPSATPSRHDHTKSNWSAKSDQTKGKLKSDQTKGKLNQKHVGMIRGQLGQRTSLGEGHGGGGKPPWCGNPSLPSRWGRSEEPETMGWVGAEMVSEVGWVWKTVEGV